MLRHRQQLLLLVIAALAGVGLAWINIGGGYQPAVLRRGCSAPSAESPLWRRIHNKPQELGTLIGQPMPQHTQRWRMGTRHQATSSFSGFTNLFERHGSSNSSVPLAYELRMLELESRVLKLEGMTRGGSKSLKSGATSKEKPSDKGVTSNSVLPQGEQLLLGCTFAGAMLGLIAGRALIRPHMYLGCIGGAVLGTHFSNKENNFGACIRALGKLTLYACDRLAYAWSELKFNWKAWRLYEKSFKKLETLDKEMQVSAKIKDFDRQYQVSDNVAMWWRRFQTGAKEIEANVREQAVYWQRAQRLRDEQNQAAAIQQEIQRQQAKEQKKNGGGGGGQTAAAAAGSGAPVKESVGASTGGGAFQAIVGDGKWGDRSSMHGSAHHPHANSPDGDSSSSTKPPSPADVAAARSAKMNLSSDLGHGGEAAGSTIGDSVVQDPPREVENGRSLSTIGTEIGKLFMQVQGTKKKTSSSSSSSNNKTSPPSKDDATNVNSQSATSSSPPVQMLNNEDSFPTFSFGSSKQNKNNKDDAIGGSGGDIIF